MTRAPVAATLLVAASTSWNFTDLGAAAERLSLDYGIGLPAVGLLTTVLVLAHTAVQLPGGKASDRIGAARIAMSGLVLVALTNAAALAAPAPGLAFAARTLMGVGTGTAFVAGIDAVRAGGGSGALQGLYGGASFAGAGLALAVVPQLEPAVGWRAPYVSGLVLALVALALLAVAPPPRKLVPLHGERAPLGLSRTGGSTGSACCTWPPTASRSSSATGW